VLGVPGTEPYFPRAGGGFAFQLARAQLPHLNPKPMQGTARPPCQAWVCREFRVHGALAGVLVRGCAARGALVAGHGGASRACGTPREALRAHQSFQATAPRWLSAVCMVAGLAGAAAFPGTDIMQTTLNPLRTCQISGCSLLSTHAQAPACAGSLRELPYAYCSYICSDLSFSGKSADAGKRGVICGANRHQVAVLCGLHNV